MIAHISIGVRDIDRSKRFYDAALEALGYKCLRAARTLLGYGYGRDSIALWVVQAERPVPADEKSGLHFCFTAANAAAVDAFHAAAMRSGGTTMVRPVCARFTAPITTLHSSSIQTDTGLRRITVQPKPDVSYNHRPGNLRWPG
jgi:catechol 2,3-dioxygenase-like lactoylglutathione lyase family enzyme